MLSSYFIDAILRTDPPDPPLHSTNVHVLCLKDALRKKICDLQLLFLSFSKMFIGGLSWQTTQGELSRTLL